MFSATKIAGRFQIVARFSDSNVVPWLDAPSPKNATATPPSPLNLDARARPQIATTLAGWQKDADLAELRDAWALAKLSAEERDAFLAFWADVEALRKRAEGK